MQNIGKSETKFADKLTELQSDAQKQRDSTLLNLEKLSSEFAPQLSKLRSDIQGQKEAVWQNMKQAENCACDSTIWTSARCTKSNEI